MSNNQRLTNGIGDDWFNKCCESYTVFKAFYASFKMIFHFDSLNWIAIELLIIMPIFFRLYGFGIQQNLTRFYNKSRLQILNFLFFFSFITVFSILLQYLMPRSPACLIWDGNDLNPSRPDNGSPSVIIMLTTILFLMFLRADFKGWILVIIFAGFFFIMTTISSILSGSSSIFQALLSVCFGCWVFYVFNFLPPVFVPIVYLLISIAVVTIFGPEVVRYNKAASYLAKSGIRSTFLLTVTVILYILNAKSIDGFKWFQIQWYDGLLTSSKDDSVAIIPTVLRVTDEDRFGRKLNKDIIYSVIAFVAVLIFNSIFVHFLDYRFYQD
ncbi:hypothetical protein TVAG_437360 [Trichomonas vaginalis G3]|uniref:Uncharacterized protein n=1 Tax=Trichomonas vaginalis (strain ATCC PRA-98 / G3) TaxID=412133 RepID=A2DFI2_TRIV3|nr:hypothetical protein TVAGG3_0564710 [Trichomonas vaginalis G3]EAY20910.1 hypothetical protein TVAG_437360 [Trichomonas vaginalis G3]KAI5521479.1 hypothetical protein TVAGG3_0564710 [Trichomonas vaginalis G3]|eukprot:XP_001581896.1 hypothetical protein [Trichomonas vaginalis G3]